MAQHTGFRPLTAQTHRGPVTWAYDIVGGSGIICTISTEIYDRLFSDRKARREYERGLKKGQLIDVLRHIRGVEDIILDPIDNFVDFERTVMSHVEHREVEHPDVQSGDSGTDILQAVLEDGRSVRAAWRRLSGPDALVPALQYQLTDFAFLVEFTDQRSKGELEALADRFVEDGEQIDSVVEETDAEEYSESQSQSAMWVSVCVSVSDESAGIEDDFGSVDELIAGGEELPADLVPRMERAQALAAGIGGYISSGSYSYVERGSDLAVAIRQGYELE